MNTGVLLVNTGANTAALLYAVVLLYTGVPGIDLYEYTSTLVTGVLLYKKFAKRSLEVVSFGTKTLFNTVSCFTGVDAYVVKPFNHRDLYEKVMGAIANRSLPPSN